MERETLFYWIALGLGICAFIVGIISISTLAGYGGKLGFYSLLSLMIMIFLIVNQVG